MGQRLSTTIGKVWRELGRNDTILMFLAAAMCLLVFEFPKSGL